VKPQGWLKAQLQLQANSLSGALDEFWPDVKDSGWFGGDADAGVLRAEGVQAVLQKPFASADLVEAVARVNGSPA